MVSNSLYFSLPACLSGLFLSHSRFPLNLSFSTGVLTLPTTQWAYRSPSPTPFFPPPSSNTSIAFTRHPSFSSLWMIVATKFKQSPKMSKQKKRQTTITLPVTPALKPTDIPINRGNNSGHRHNNNNGHRHNNNSHNNIIIIIVRRHLLTSKVCFRRKNLCNLQPS